MVGWPRINLVFSHLRAGRMDWKLEQCTATRTLLSIETKGGVLIECDAALHVACETAVGQEVVNSVHVLGSSLLSPITYHEMDIIRT